MVAPAPRGRRRRLASLCLLLAVPAGVKGFVGPVVTRGGLSGGGAPPFRRGGAGDGSHPGVATLRYPLTLGAARSAASRKGPDRKARKAGGARSDRGRPGTGGAAPSAVAAPKRQARTPPWHVLSARDAKRNIEREVERRRLAQEGALPSHGRRGEGPAEPAPSKLSRSFLKPSLRRFLNWKRVSPFTNALQLSFSGSHLESRTLPDSTGVPEIAFLGRSNVGKSSLLNRLATMSAPATGGAAHSGSAGRRALARVGQTPGATASVNFYTLSQITPGGKAKEWMQFVDLPGYGYARLGRDRQDAIQRVAESYLRDSRRTHALALCVLLLDVRRDPAPDDAALLAALYDLGRPLLVVATKRDKVPGAAAQAARLARIRDALGLPEGQPLCVSSATGEGCRDLWQILLEACETSVDIFRRDYDGDDDETSENTEEDEWEDEEDTVYSQGYDWIHGTNGAVMYDGEMDENDEPNYYEGKDDGTTDVMTDSSAVEKETFKSLKQKARRMQRRGEI